MTGTNSLDSLIRTRRIIVCVGSGGVGKTTVAAGLGVAGAWHGRRTLVVTIDPARRLADALGLAELGDEPRPIATHESAEGKGSLHAMMLDPKRTLDDMVDRFSQSSEIRDRILENNLYQHFSDALAGSAEYAAMEKMHELLDRDDFDLIILDTPPAQHAFDFLDAPERLAGFQDSRLVKFLLRPAFSMGRLSLRIFQSGTRSVLGLIERVSGVGFTEDLSEFLVTFETIAEGFRGRAQETRRRLLGDDAAFVLVTGPQRDLCETAIALLLRLQERGAPLAGVLANRVRSWPGPAPLPTTLLTGAASDEAIQVLAPALADSPERGEALAQAAIEVTRGYAREVESDRQQLSGLRGEALERKLFFQEIPEFEQDIHNLEGIRLLTQRLCAIGMNEPENDGA